MSNQKKKPEAEDGLGEVAKLKAGYLLQIRLLQSDLDHMRQQNSSLRSEHEALKAELAKKEEEEDGLFFSLRKKLKSAEAQVLELQSQVQAADHRLLEVEKQRDSLQELIATNESSSSARILELEKKVEEQRSQLNDYHEFALEKDAIEARVRELERRLEDNKVEHLEQIAEMERIKVQEKERLKREMLVKIKETKTYLLSLTEDQLDTTTKRTILENEHMLTELQHQYGEITRILQQLSDLQQRNKSLSREVILLRQQNAMIAEKSRMVKPLTNKLKDIYKGKERQQEHGGDSEDSRAIPGFNCSVRILQAQRYLEDIVQLAQSAPSTELRRKGTVLQHAVQRCLALLPARGFRTEVTPPQKGNPAASRSPRKAWKGESLQSRPCKLYPSRIRVEQL